MKLPPGWITGRKKVTMRKFLTSTLAALIFGGAIAATALPSQAGSYRHRGHHKHNDATAAAIIAGIAGLAIGAAIVGSYNDRRDYRTRGYYDPHYRYRYKPGYAHARRHSYHICIRRERVWDPYADRVVMVERTFPC